MVGARGQSPWKILRFDSVRDPLICLFFDRCERKNNAQEDYNGYKKAFGWYKVVIVKVGIEATC